MPVKDPVAVMGPRSDAARSARRDAVGAEIPVTVHASRTTQGLGKNLPAVHEDTKTVIVLQQGAVVRLTADLVTGETVVLTNRMTGADVLCRVGKIKSQPGIQHYVDLEFAQRAPVFWGDALAAVNAPAAEAPAAVSAPPAPRAPVAVVPPPAPEPIVPPAADPILVAPAPPAPPDPAPAVELPPAAVAKPIQIQTAPVAEPIAPSWKQSQPTPVAPIRGALNQPAFGGISEEIASSRSGSRNTLMVAAAVALLVLGGGAGGYWFYSHRTASASAPTTQPAATVAPLQVTPDLTTVSAPISDPAPPALTATETGPQMDLVVESRPPAEAPAPRVQPAPISTARTPPPAARRNTVPIGQLKAPQAKTTTARTDSSAPPPVIVGAVGLSDGGAASALLAAEPAGPAPPLAIGGQLQQPQLISSTAAVYPPNARMQRIQGTVVLDALVDESGNVVETKVIAGPQPLLLAAQDAVRNWKYKPAQLNGKPIAVHTKVSVRFALQ
jgi:protein TonB